MLLSHHSSFRISTHRWSRYELREPGDVCVRHGHSHTIRRGVAAIRRRNRHGDGADVMERGGSESLNFCLGGGRVSTAMDNGVTNALVNGIGESRVGVHEPA